MTKTAAAVAAAALWTLVAAAPARAQLFVSPFAAVDVGADAGCLNLLVCANRYLNAGAAAGRLGGTYGAEEEVSYARDFFGNGPNLSSSMLTVMSNAIVLRQFGRWHPYAEGGVGVMRTYVKFTDVSYYATNRVTAAWDAGGGVATYVSGRFGVRADARYFRSIKDVRLSGFSVSDDKMGFGRLSAGLVVRF